MVLGIPLFRFPFQSYIRTKGCHLDNCSSYSYISKYMLDINEDSIYKLCITLITWTYLQIHHMPIGLQSQKMSEYQVGPFLRLGIYLIGGSWLQSQCEIKFKNEVYVIFFTHTITLYLMFSYR